MAMKVTIVMILLMASLLLTCREVPIDFPLPSQNLTSLVVEGILTNEKINHRIKLTLPYTLQNGNAKPATGAIVTISDGTDVALLTEYPAGSGEYYTSQGRAVFGKTYTLTIQYQGRTYVAKDSSVPVEPLQTLDYRRVNDLYTLNLPRITGQDAHYIDHQINWTNTPACIAGSTCKGRVMSYHLNTIDVNEIFKPEKATFYFPVNTTIIRTKYSVSPAYKAFLRSVLSETEWRGGVFDVQHADATTNLSEGAIGFFAVSTVVSDTTVVIQKP
jgi:hypothetical protein